MFSILIAILARANHNFMFNSWCDCLIQFGILVTLNSVESLKQINEIDKNFNFILLFLLFSLSWVLITVLMVIFNSYAIYIYRGWLKSINGQAIESMNYIIFFYYYSKQYCSLGLGCGRHEKTILLFWCLDFISPELWWLLPTESFRDIRQSECLD